MPAPQKRGNLRNANLAFVFLWFFIGGIAHFAFTQAEMSIIPPDFPNHRQLVLISGGFELLGAFGILVRRTRAAAGWGLLLLTAAVTPANIYMWRHAANYPAIPPWALTLRLPFQALLMAAIWWSTRAASPPASRTPRGRWS